MSDMRSIATRWPVRRARFLFREINERGYDLPLASVTRDGGVEFRSDLDVSVWNPGDDVSGYKRVMPGDFVIGLRSFQSGLGYSPLEGLVSPAYSVLRPKSKEVHDGYFRHLFKSDVLVSLLGNIAQGIRQGRTIAVEDFNELRLPLPSILTQRAIADYLDRETARIDRLIAAKKRMIAISQERMSAAVSQATQADLAIRPSARLPRGWKLTPLKRCLRSTDYGIGESTQAEGEYPVLGMANISLGEVVGSPGGFVPAVDGSLLLAPGDLLFNRTNSRELVGKVGLVRSLDGPTTFASYLVRLRVNRLTSPEYLNYLLNSREVLGLARSLALPSIGQANLNPSRYAAISLPIPPINEQRQVIGRLDASASGVADLRRALERQIELLKQRRQAAVTAAVTGGMDLRVSV